MPNSKSTLNLLLRRIAAFLYDCLLLIAIFFVVTAAILPINDGEAFQHWSYFVFLGVVAFLFFDGFWRHGGQTLGMRAWRLRLEGSYQVNVTFEQSLRRYLLGVLTFGVTLIFMFRSTTQQALHDRLSETKIVLYYN